MNSILSQNEEEEENDSDVAFVSDMEMEQIIKIAVHET